ncbi:uncharacterized protein [Primulina huaijiensis]|uniref:uncharacterized protein n=1 Tax=Primulina huaijiensis TaxID=1492673 RepID=UPI003CC70385
MAEKKEQEKPLAHRIDIDRNESFAVEFMKPRHRNCVKCCGCTTAILLILVTTVIILMVTIFHLKDPVLIFNMSKIEGLDVLKEAKAPSGLNLRSEAEVSIKNPNVVSFKFNNTTTIVYYDGFVIGEAVNPSGQAKARRTLRMNVLMYIMVDKILAVPRLRDDLVAKTLPFSTYTRITGKVKLANVIQKRFVVTLNCTVDVSVSGQTIEDKNCKTQYSY